MSKLTIYFNDDSHKEIEINKENFPSEEALEEHIQAEIQEALDKGLTETGRMWVGDKPTENVVSVKAEEDTSLKPDWEEKSKETYTKDAVYLADKIRKAVSYHFVGEIIDDKGDAIEVVGWTNNDYTSYDELDTACKDKLNTEYEGKGYAHRVLPVYDGTLKGMPVEEFVAFIDRLDIELSLNIAKHGNMGVDIDTEIENVNEEHLVNALANLPRPIVATYNEQRGLWESFLILRDALLVSTSRTQAGAALRSLIALRTGKIHNNSIYLNDITKYWTNVNQQPDPFDKTKETLEKLAQAAGTTLSEIDKEYEEMAKAQPEA